MNKLISESERYNAHCNDCGCDAYHRIVVINGAQFDVCENCEAIEEFDDEPQ
ncbi:TPA: hypothetical protein KDX89_000090 [Vibrio parahaemolyticus]|nr:hypothetical protein [Vibrio parahaemolyticus]